MHKPGKLGANPNRKVSANSIAKYMQDEPTDSVYENKQHRQINSDGEHFVTLKNIENSELSHELEKTSKFEESKINREGYSTRDKFLYNPPFSPANVQMTLLEHTQDMSCTP